LNWILRKKLFFKKKERREMVVTRLGPFCTIQKEDTNVSKGKFWMSKTRKIAMVTSWAKKNGVLLLQNLHTGKSAFHHSNSTHR
jgi:hypothetical protein